MTAEELRASINRAADMPPPGEPTSAALRRVTAERDQANELTDKIAVELRGVTKERDALARRCAVRFEETRTLRQQLAEARTDADVARAELESARAELALLRRQNTTLRADLTRAQNRAEAAERAVTYLKEKGMTPEEHYQHAVSLLAEAETHPSDDPAGAQTLAAVAHGHFSAAAAGVAMRAWEELMTPSAALADASLTAAVRDQQPSTDAAKLLDLPLPANDADAATVRDYLIELLRIAWKQGEDFCKRPFGNSGWQHDIYEPMVKAGLVSGSYDEDGYLEHADTHTADVLMDKAIRALGGTDA